MFRMILPALIWLSILGLGAQHAHAQRDATYNPPHGLWLTENGRSVIEIRECERGLCGDIYWIIEGGMRYDEHNPDANLRGQPLCGLPIMWGFKRQNERNWIDGTIYKADEGDHYSATLQMLPSGNMLVRGYVGVPLFGKSQTWTKVGAQDYKRCVKP